MELDEIGCVICNGICDSSGLCDDHKYDEQLEYLRTRKRRCNIHISSEDKIKPRKYTDEDHQVWFDD